MPSLPTNKLPPRHHKNTCTAASSSSVDAQRNSSSGDHELKSDTTTRMRSGNASTPIERESISSYTRTTPNSSHRKSGWLSSSTAKKNKRTASSGSAILEVEEVHPPTTRTTTTPQQASMSSSSISKGHSASSQLARWSPYAVRRLSLDEEGPRNRCSSTAGEATSIPHSNNNGSSTNRLLESSTLLSSSTDPTTTSRTGIDTSAETLSKNQPTVPSTTTAPPVAAAPPTINAESLRTTRHHPDEPQQQQLPTVPVTTPNTTTTASTTTTTLASSSSTTTHRAQSPLATIIGIQPVTQQVPGPATAAAAAADTTTIATHQWTSPSPSIRESQRQKRKRRSTSPPSTAAAAARTRASTPATSQKKGPRKPRSHVLSITMVRPMGPDDSNTNRLQDSESQVVDTDNLPPSPTNDHSTNNSPIRHTDPSVAVPRNWGRPHSIERVQCHYEWTWISPINPNVQRNHRNLGSTTAAPSNPSPPSTTRKRQGTTTTTRLSRMGCQEAWYDSTVWTVEQQQQHPGMGTSSTKLLRVTGESSQPSQQGTSSASAASLFLPMTPPPLSRKPLLPDWLSTARRKRTNRKRRPSTTSGDTGKKQKPRKDAPEHTSVIRVGPDYQAIVPPWVGPTGETSYNLHPNDKDDDTSGDRSTRQVLWDPMQANRALYHGQDWTNLLDGTHTRNLDDTMTKLECLTRSNYQIEAALQSYNDTEPRSSHLDWSDKERRIFEQLVPRKNFREMSLALNRSEGQVLAYYYKWKGLKRDAYEVGKRQRRKEPDECSICHDGGLLLMCDCCRKAYHLECLIPPLKQPPIEDEWYCSRCMETKPASVRRLSLSQSRLDTSPHGKTTHAEPPNPNQRRQLLDIHKELFSHHDGSHRSRVRSVLSETPSNNDTATALPAAALADSPSKSISETIAALDAASDHSVHPYDDDNNNSTSSSSSSSSKSSMSGAVEESERKPARKVGKRSHDQSDSSYNDSGNGSENESLLLEEIETDKHERKARVAKAGGAAKLSGAHTPCHPQRPTGSTETHSFRLNGVSYVNYFVMLPFDPQRSLGIKVAEAQDKSVIFAGYTDRDGEVPGVAEALNAFRAIGDTFLSVDGHPVPGNAFQTVVTALKTFQPGQRYKCLVMRHKISTVTGSSSDAVPDPHLEYQVVLPLDPQRSLGFKVVEAQDKSVIFAGYADRDGGLPGVALKMKAFKATGDIILSVDGHPVLGKPFHDVVNAMKMFQPGQKYKVLVMRHKAFSVTEASSGGVPNGQTSAPQHVPALERPPPFHPRQQMDLSDRPTRNNLQQNQSAAHQSLSSNAPTWTTATREPLQQQYQPPLTEVRLAEHRRAAAEQTALSNPQQGSSVMSHHAAPSVAIPSHDAPSQPRTLTATYGSKDPRSSAQGSLERLRGAEYAVRLPFDKFGYLGIRILTNSDERHFFDGYASNEIGRKAEISQFFKEIGDEIVSVDGVPVHGKSLSDVRSLLRQIQSNQAFKQLVMRNTERKSVQCSDTPHSTTPVALRSDGISRHTQNLMSVSTNPASKPHNGSQVSGVSSFSPAQRSRHLLSTDAPTNVNVLPVGGKSAVPQSSESSCSRQALHQDSSHEIQTGHKGPIPEQNDPHVLTDSSTESSLEIAPSKTNNPNQLPKALVARQARESSRAPAESATQASTQPSATNNSVPTLQLESNSLVAPSNADPGLYETFNSDASFLTFLRRLGIGTVAALLQSDSEWLADVFAEKTGLERPIARDFIGAMKFRASLP